MIDLNAALTRCLAIAKEALDGAGYTLDGKPYFRHTQEAFPYMIWRVAEDDLTDEGEEIDLDSYTLVGRLVIGHVTAGYKGELESRLYTYIPLLKAAFANNEELKSTAYPADLVDLQWARLQRVTGYRELPHSGLTNGIQICCEVIITCTFVSEIDQDHL